MNIGDTGRLEIRVKWSEVAELLLRNVQEKSTQYGAGPTLTVPYTWPKYQTSERDVPLLLHPRYGMAPA